MLCQYHVTLHESCNLKQIYKLWFSRVEGFWPRGRSHTQSQRPVVVPDPLWPLTLAFTAICSLTQTHTFCLTGQQGSLMGASVWVLGGSQTGQHLLPLRVWALRSTWRARCRGLSSPLSLFFLFSSSYPLNKASCLFSIKRFDPSSAFAVFVSSLLLCR